MSHFSAARLQHWTAGHWHGGATPARSVRGFSADTRTLRSGDCFVALRTEKRDGHDFLGEAAQRGAAAAIVERAVAGAPLPQLVTADPLTALQSIARQWRLFCAGCVIGITGSVGKTSTKDMLARIFGASALATRANLNNFLGVPLTVLEMRPARQRAGLIVEAGMSEPGELEGSARVIQPDVALITNVRSAHLAGMGTLEAIAREKSALARQLRPGGTAIFAAECLEYDAFRSLRDFWRDNGGEQARRIMPVFFPEDDILTLPQKYGCEKNFVSTVFEDVEGGRIISLRDHRNRVFQKFFFPHSTQGMARNAALAATAAHFACPRNRCQTVAPEPGAFRPRNRIHEAMRQWRPSPKRGETLHIGERLFYVDCYNANPASLADAVQEFDRQTRNAAGRLFVLAGMNELGADSAALHKNAGRALPLRTGDRLVLFGGDSAALGEGAVSAGFSAAAITHADTIDAVRTAIASAPSAPVLLKGSRAYALERVLG